MTIQLSIQLFFSKLKFVVNGWFMQKRSQLIIPINAHLPFSKYYEELIIYMTKSLSSWYFAPVSLNTELCS